MDRDEALRMLGLSGAEGPTARDEAYISRKDEITRRLAEPPTESLKERYQQDLETLAEARRAVEVVPGTSVPQLSATQLADLPAATPSYTEAGENAPAGAQVGLASGKVLAGRYEVRRRIGAGGMGAVFAVWDRVRKKEIAIKVLLPGLLKDAAARERFLQEGQISCELGHPNIVNVYDVHDDGELHFLSMELMEGRTLRDEIEEHRRAGRLFPIERAVEITRSVCEALSYAHRRTVHRDVKPENVFLGSDGAVKLMDFGIARLLSASQLTLTGASLGTAYYMAPEQLRSHHEVDHRADQYAMAAMLYEMLTGEVPAGRVESLHRRRPEVPRSWSRAVDRALSRRPEDRFEGMASFASTLKERVAWRVPRIPREHVGLAGAAILLLLLGWTFRGTVADWARAVGMGTRLEYPTREGLLPGELTYFGTRWLRHGDAVESVAFSPDGRYLASGDRVGILKVWDLTVPGGGCVLDTKHRGETRVAFSPDSRLLASGGSGSVITLWEVASGREVRTLDAHSGDVRSVAFSPNGQLLASGSEQRHLESEDPTIKLWDTSSGQELRTLEGHSAYVTSVAFSPDGQMLASGSGDQTIKLWAVASGRELRTLEGHSGIVRSVAFSPDGQLLGSGSTDETIRLWDTSNGKEVRTLKGHSSYVNSVAFSPDGRLLASGCLDDTIKLWDTSNGQEVRTFEGHSWDVNSVAFSPDGQLLASGSGDKTIKLWELASGRERRILEGHSLFVHSVAFSPDGQLLASASGDKTIKLWDVASGREVRTLTVQVGSVAFSPHGRLLAGGRDKTIKLWDTSTGQEVRTFEAHSGATRVVAFSPDGELLASGSQDGVIELWEAASGREVRTMKGHSEFLDSVAFSPDGQLLASGGGDATIKLWDVAIGREVRTMKGHSTYVSSVAFSPDGRLLASGSGDRTIKLWEVASGRELQTLQRPIEIWSQVGTVAFSADGRLLVSLGRDGLSFFSLPDGVLIHRDPMRSQSPEAISCSSKDTLFATGNGDTTISLFRLPSVE